MSADSAIVQMSDEEFRAHTLSLVSREFGPGGYARFLSMFCSGPGDYTRDRGQWLRHLTLEDIWQELEAQGGVEGE